MSKEKVAAESALKKVQEQSQREIKDLKQEIELNTGFDLKGKCRNCGKPKELKKEVVKEIVTEEKQAKKAKTENKLI